MCQTWNSIEQLLSLRIDTNSKMVWWGKTRELKRERKIHSEKSMEIVTIALAYDSIVYIYIWVGCFFLHSSNSNCIRFCVSFHVWCTHTNCMPTRIDWKCRYCYSNFNIYLTAMITQRRVNSCFGPYSAQRISFNYTLENCLLLYSMSVYVCSSEARLYYPYMTTYTYS